MKINVHAGHTKQSGKAPGASGFFHESIEDRKVKNALKKILRKRGVKVWDCTSQGRSMYDNLARIVRKCNKHEVDLDLSIHFNCYNGSGHGTEAWIYPGNKKSGSYAKKIVKNLARIGFSDRGVKSSSDLYVLRHTESPACLVEVCFCDNKGDYKIYKKAGVKKIATAIADAIAPRPKKRRKRK